MIRATLFDFDGLLADTEPVYLAGWRHVFHREGLDIPEAVLAGWVGKSTDYVRRCVGELYGDEALYDRLYAARERFVYRALRSGEIRGRPYAKAALRAAHVAGAAVAIVSSSRRERLDDIAGEIGLLAYVDVVVSAEDVARHKPCPDPYLRALELIGCAAEEAVAFEDTVIGCEAAIAAGVPVWLIPSQEERSRPPAGARLAPDLSVVPCVLAEARARGGAAAS